MNHDDIYWEPPHVDYGQGHWMPGFIGSPWITSEMFREDFILFQDLGMAPLYSYFHSFYPKWTEGNVGHHL